MYLRQHSLGAPQRAGSSEAAEKTQRAETDRACKGVRVLEWLQKDGADSLRAYIAYLERRLAATPRLVEGHHQLRKLVDALDRALRAQGRPAIGPLRARFDQEKKGLFARYPEMGRFSFPPGYVVRTAAEEVAQVRCKLSRARLDFQIWNRTGRRPQGTGFVRLCSPQPGRPLTLWTFGGFGPNNATLNPAQLSEIKLIAGGLARNPRTRTGKPVLTITGGFAPGENPTVGNARAIAVKTALFDALKQIDLSLLGVVGFQLAANPWCGEVAISLRERIPPPPNLRLPSNRPPGPRNPLAPTGTPLPAGPSPGRPAPGAQDRIRRRIDGILRKHGVKDATKRKAVVDSALFQGEAAVRSAVGKTGLDFKQQQAVVDEILSRKRP
jgi:hypothetical protein